MPRAFNAAEREAIQAKLFAAGLEQFGRHGLRRTNVAGLARSAGIAKGSFYLFFPSKESLLLALLWDEQLRMRRALGAVVDDASATPRDKIERLLRVYLECFAGNLVFSALADLEDAEALVRALPPGALDRAQADEDAHFLDLLQASQEAGELTPLDTQAWIGLLRMIRSIADSRDRIGHERFAKTLDLLVASLSDYLAW